MSTTISFPSDPVTKGATLIQTSTFALVAADYTKVDLATVSRFIADNGSLDSLPNPNNKGANGLPDWQFFRRKDLSGAAAAYGNLVGVKNVVTSRNIPAWSPDLSVKAGIPVVTRRIEVYNWHVALMSLDSGVVVPVWMVAYASYTLIADPQGTVLYGAGNSRALEEATGFALTRVAADEPTNERALAVAFGMNPLG